MAKKSAQDLLIARLDADIARVYMIENYVGGEGSEALTARIQADLAKYDGMRNYVTAAVPVAGEVPDTPTKRTRKPKRVAGLPASGEVTQ